MTTVINYGNNLMVMLLINIKNKNSMSQPLYFSESYRFFNNNDDDDDGNSNAFNLRIISVVLIRKVMRSLSSSDKFITILMIP